MGSDCFSKQAVGQLYFSEVLVLEVKDVLTNILRSEAKDWL